MIKHISIKSQNLFITKINILCFKKKIVKMNYRLLYKIAKQIYKIASDLPRLPLPKQIEKEALNCYYDYVNNDGKNGQDSFVNTPIGKLDCKKYIIKNVKEKCKNWQFYNAIKDRFNNEIIINFVDKKWINHNSMTSIKHEIFICINHDAQDEDDLTHELQHYFQHLILDQNKLKEIIQENTTNNNTQDEKYLLSKGQYIQQIGSCCKRFFNLYMKSFYKEISFEQFYEKHIQNKLEINIDKLQSSRFENYCKNSLLFLSLIKNRNKDEYQKIKAQIYDYVEQELKEEHNLQKVLQSKNYSLMQNLILQNKQDEEFINTVIQILTDNQKFKLLTAIIEHFKLFDKIDYNSIQPYHLLLIVKNCKNKDAQKEIIKNVSKSMNIHLINYFIPNIKKAITDISLLQECNIILRNWIFNIKQGI